MANIYQFKNPLIFPQELQNTGQGRPMVVFTQNTYAMESNKSRLAIPNIYLPIPQSISTNDKADYGAKALGILGAATAALTKKNTSTTLEDITSNVSAASTSFKESPLASKIGAITNIFKGASDELKTAVNIGSGTVPNPYLTTEFTGVETRQFSFSFKMIPSSEEEAVAIRDIVYAFRLGVYPLSNQYQLTYPPTWRIRFISHNPGNTGADAVLTEIENIPKILECYLVDAQVTFNAAGNMWYSDGAPLETDLALSFMETRALTYKDILTLNTTNDISKFSTTSPSVGPELYGPPAPVAPVPNSNTIKESQINQNVNRSGVLGAGSGGSRIGGL